MTPTDGIHAAIGVLCVLVAPSPAQTAGPYDLTWNTSDGGGGTAVAGTYVLSGTAGQPDAHAMTAGSFELRGGFWHGGAASAAACTTAADCADADDNGVTDDVCVWWECVAGSCNGVSKTVPADLGGSFGACTLDTFCNIHDANHTLSCFSGLNTCDTANVDAGGAFGACPPDGFCNIHDANHALACFGGMNTCVCPSSPAPEGGPTIVGNATLVLVPTIDGEAALTLGSSLRNARPGDMVDVRVFINENDPLAALQSYQLHLAASGGRIGRLELVDIGIEDRKDFVFGESADTFTAFNVGTSQMLAGLYDLNASTAIRVGAARGAGAYLATFTYRVSAEAAGQFVIDVLHDEEVGDQTYLVGSRLTDKIEITRTVPCTIVVPRGGTQHVGGAPDR